MALIRLNNQSISSVTALPSGVGGKVLQTVQGTNSDIFTTTSTSLVKVPSFNVDITPSSTSSKILVSWSAVSYPSIYTRYINYSIIRTIGGSDTDVSGESNFFGWSYDDGTSAHQSIRTLCYLDSPSTTSTITYSPAIKWGGGSGDAKFGDNGARSVIIATEIGA